MSTLQNFDIDLEELGEICRRFGIAQLEVFGSAARGELDDLSDVDLLYVMRPGTRMGWEIEDLAAQLAEVFGRPVDLVARRALHTALRDRVLAEAFVLYAA